MERHKRWRQKGHKVDQWKILGAGRCKARSGAKDMDKYMQAQKVKMDTRMHKGREPGHILTYCDTDILFDYPFVIMQM